MKQQKILKSYKIFLIIAIILVIFSAIFVFLSRKTIIFSSFKKQEFPTYKAESLNPKQQKIINILKKEYQKQPKGTKYSQGVKEPWCADFVSWVMKEAGLPFSNPHSGSWRIPGVYTLQEYFESTNQWHDYGDYQPKTGDIVIYKDNSMFSGHTNFVLKNSNGYLTTIGGNEMKKIRIQKFKFDDSIGIKGFGELK